MASCGASVASWHEIFDISNIQRAQVVDLPLMIIHLFKWSSKCLCGRRNFKITLFVLHLIYIRELVFDLIKQKLGRAWRPAGRASRPGTRFLTFRTFEECIL